MTSSAQPQPFGAARRRSRARCSPRASGRSAGAIQSIWKKWSMNDSVRTPMASARCARSATPGPMPAGPPAQSKRETWKSRSMLSSRRSRTPSMLATPRLQRPGNPSMLVALRSARYWPSPALPSPLSARQKSFALLDQRHAGHAVPAGVGDAVEVDRDDARSPGSRAKRGDSSRTSGSSHVTTSPRPESRTMRPVRRTRRTSA